MPGGAQAAHAAHGALERLALLLQAARLFERQRLDHRRLALLQALVERFAVALEHAAHVGHDGRVLAVERPAAGRQAGAGVAPRAGVGARRPPTLGRCAQVRSG